jgi:ATP-dependent DNA helicase
LMLAPYTQIVLISAVIANAARIAEWLLGNPELVVDGTGLLPTSRSIAFTTWRNPLGALEYVNPLDPEDREFFVPRVIEAVTLPALPRERTPRVFPKAEDGPSVGSTSASSSCPREVSRSFVDGRTRLPRSVRMPQQ